MVDTDMEWSLKRLEGSIDVLVAQRDGWRERAQAAEAELVTLRAVRDRLNDDALAKQATPHPDNPDCMCWGCTTADDQQTAINRYRAAVLGKPTP